MYDIIIIGAGPSGLTAALYARRAMKKVLLLEGMSYGGQIINTLKIDNYPALNHVSGFDFATNLYNQVKELDTKIEFEKVLKIENNQEYKEVITKENIYKTKTIIIATGTRVRKLGLLNEEKLVGRGVSYCASCDGGFFKNKDVAVIGGGNTAIEDAIYLSDIASNIYLIHRRDTFRAEEKQIEILKSKKNIHIIYNSNVVKLNGEDKLESVEIETTKNEKKTINVSGIFIAIGQIPESEIFKNLLNLDDNNYIITNEQCQTNIEGIFAAGDIRHKSLRQLVTATSDGAIAIDEAIKYINKLSK